MLHKTTPFAWTTGLCDNPTTLILRLHRVRPSRVAHFVVIADICDPQSINARTGTHCPYWLHIRMTAVPKTLKLPLLTVPTNDVSSVLGRLPTGAADDDGTAGAWLIELVPA